MGQETLKELRNQKGWSQNDLSSLSGLSVRTIQRMENGTGAPSSETAKALASVFNRPFSDFLSSTESSTQHSDSAKTKETASPQESADVRTNFLHDAKPYWRPAVLIVLVATLSGFLTKMYLDEGAPSAGSVDIASSRASELASGPPGASAGFAPTASRVQEIFRNLLLEFPQYYGRQSLANAFQSSDKPEGTIHLNLIELVMLIDVAAIVSGWEDTAGLNSDIRSPEVLKNHLRCYGDSRTPSDSVSESIAKMNNCIRAELSDAYWELDPAMNRALTILALTVRQMGPLSMWKLSFDSSLMGQRTNL